jgi:uncharacterized RDD family membrane protein YckC
LAAAPLTDIGPAERARLARAFAGPSYGGFWRRVAASLLDSIWQFELTSLVGLALYGSQYAQGATTFLLEFVLPALAVLAFWRWRRTTPGKLLMDLVIADAVTGGPPSTTQYVLRYLGYFVSLLPLGLGFIWIAFDPRRQGWHDKIAKTVVVRAPYD